MSVYEFQAADIKGVQQPLSDYEGKVLLVVNTASKCGFTPQYKGLQELYDRYSEKGFEILGFPCDQFMNQEPGTEDEIAAFCERNYGVAFPMFSKIKVNGKEAHPLFSYLTTELPGMLGSEGVKWNFTKFLIARDGKPFKRFAPNTNPKELEKDIEQLLKQGNL
ncbi:redoxin domain-containing protein [Bacillus mangrovi]|uniref:Glutathione peroxidase n=1 Tax=Metabacillus mangrovi TaxID=1491830 RepID=A0A7X2S1Y3_9BACI|nr:glutathione peroxidase [Metabacillus mangrovi]MTH52085.1 redoxin domain-containing protein [Metabacillus mangrovi]